MVIGKKIITLFILSLTLITGNLHSQDTLSKKELKKKYTSYLIPGKPWIIEVPVWIPGFAGSFAYGDISLEGEDGIDPEHPIEPPGGIIGEILSRVFTKEWYLKFFFLTRVAWENKGFLVQLDGISGAVGSSIKFNYNNQEIVQASFRTTNLRLFAGYRLVNAGSGNKKFKYELYGYMGVRAYFERIFSDLNGSINKLDINPVWVEPIFGVQNQFTWKRWFVVVQGDYGGLFVESKHSVQISGMVYFRSGRMTSVKVGWNHLELNQKGNFLKEDYRIMATFSGPSVGIAFHF